MMLRTPGNVLQLHGILLRNVLQHIPQGIRIEGAAFKGEQPNRQPYKALRALTQNFLGPTIPAT